MKVLGVWDGHTASACLVADGELVAAVSEERLSRKKMQRGFPALSIAAVLQVAGLQPEQVDAVALGGQFGRYPMRALDARFSRRPPGQGPMELPARLYRHYENVLAHVPIVRSVEAAAGQSHVRRRLSALGFPNKIPITSVAHHRAHAAAAATMFPGDASVITMDGYGDGLWAATWRKEGGALSRCAAHAYLQSPAVTYGSVCQLLGFKEGEEGKVTALAARGNPHLLSDFFRRRFANSFAAMGRPLPGAGPLSNREAARLSKHAPEDVAAGVQAALEEAVVDYVRGKAHRLESHAIGLAGGLFANVAVNRRLVEGLPDQCFRVFPAMGDEGLSVGAAVAVAANATGLFPLFKSPFLGVPVDDTHVLQLARTHRFKVTQPSAPEEHLATVLARGGCVALVTGREEFGPRALGNRSLLFAATSTDLADSVQERLGRDRVMPFAPVCLAENLAAAFPPPYPCPERPDAGLELMTFALPSVLDAAARFPTAIHTDGTARIQVADPAAAPQLCRVLEQYEQLTGLKMLINTSFNLHGDPIVHGAADALGTFASAGFDSMLLGSYLVSREDRGE